MKGDTDYIAELQAIYDSEINIRIDWFWDGGVRARIGDEVNGWQDDGLFDDLRGALDWLIQRVKELYPRSWYALGKKR